MSERQNKPREFWSTPIGFLPLQRAIFVTGDATVEDAIRLMQERGKGCVCVQSNGGIEGIFTERDVMHKFVEQSLANDTPIQAVMTPDPIMVSPAAPLSEAIEIFHDRGFHHLPVGDPDGGVDGLLSVRVVVDYVAENLPGDVLNLPPDSSIVSREADGG
jgi:CBS domain-containing protein